LLFIKKISYSLNIIIFIKKEKKKSERKNDNLKIIALGQLEYLPDIPC
jgi:hypothetical protein